MGPNKRGGQLVRVSQEDPKKWPFTLFLAPDFSGGGGNFGNFLKPIL